jgi:hypothetical protein
VSRLHDLDEAELTRVLAYAGLILVAYELVKSLIVEPIKVFYADTTFAAGMPFTTYEQDVRSRHRNEFEACVLYLRDFMEAIDAADAEAIQALREHRNAVAHDLVKRLHTLNMQDSAPLLDKANKALFKLSNYRAYIEIGSDPEFQNKNIDWGTLKGHEYALFEEVLKKVTILGAAPKCRNLSPLV